MKMITLMRIMNIKDMMKIMMKIKIMALIMITIMTNLKIILNTMMMRSPIMRMITIIMIKLPLKIQQLPILSLRMNLLKYLRMTKIWKKFMKI